MEAAADDLLAALSSPSSRAGLHSRFAAYLQPFSPHLPTANPNPKPPPKRATKQAKQPPPPPDAAAVRPLAKRFLRFLCRALQLLPPLLRPNPSAAGDAGGLDELLQIYGLTLDCLAAISTCLAGKPYSVLLHRGRFVCCLESRGHYARAEAEAAATLDALRCALSPAAAAKPCRGAASVAPLLPEPATVGEAGADPEVTALAVELTVCLANCASKGKVKEAACYERVRNLVQQLRPWLRIPSEEAVSKYLTLLVNAMSRCAIFLAAESSSFDADLVREFCVATLGECERARMIERLPVVACKICSSVDLSCGESTWLLLAVFESVLHVKAYLPKALNEFLEFVAYFSRSFLSNRDVSAGASKLLYGQGVFLLRYPCPSPQFFIFMLLDYNSVDSKWKAKISPLCQWILPRMKRVYKL
ncbi:separase [Hordeum vulgare]|nr:separase [Hordeum vulgare]